MGTAYQPSDWGDDGAHGRIVPFSQHSMSVFVSFLLREKAGGKEGEAFRG